MDKSLDPPIAQPQPWSLRRPQRYIFSALIVIAMLGVMSAGVGFVSAGEGGIVPILMLVAAPALAVFYIWYFNFSDLARQS